MPPLLEVIKKRLCCFQLIFYEEMIIRSLSFESSHAKYFAVSVIPLQSCFLILVSRENNNTAKKLLEYEQKRYEQSKQAALKAKTEKGKYLHGAGRRSLRAPG